MRIFRISLALVAVLFFPRFVHAQIEPEDIKPIFRELRALEGTWFMPTDRGDRLEIWRRQNDSTLVGKDVRIKPENGDTVTLEVLRMELRDGQINYITIARGQNKNEPVSFELTNADMEGYLFENPANEETQKVRYRLLGNREIQVTTEGKRGSRVVTNEFVYEREFAPGSVEFRIRGGANMHTLRGTGYFPSDTPADKPVFDYKPSWELGAQASFKGRGGFITMNVELGLVGRSAHAKSAFTVVDDTVFTSYKRDYTYRTIWLNLGVYPEITVRRDGRLSLIAGPYLGRLIGSGGKGVILPNNDNKLYKANNDFKKTELGLLAGLQYKVNFSKKDLGGKLGLRVNLGLSDIDNLYTRYSDNAALSNGRISFQGVSFYYSFDLLKL